MTLSGLRQPLWAVGAPSTPPRGSGPAISALPCRPPPVPAHGGGCAADAESCKPCPSTSKRWNRSPLSGTTKSPGRVAGDTALGLCQAPHKPRLSGTAVITVTFTGQARWRVVCFPRITAHGHKTDGSRRTWSPPQALYSSAFSV